MTIIIMMIIIMIISKSASLYLKSLKYDFKAIWACLYLALKKLLRSVTPLD